MITRRREGHADPKCRSTTSPRWSRDSCSPSDDSIHPHQRGTSVAMSRKKRMTLGAGAAIVVAIIATLALRDRHAPLVLIGVVDANDIVVTPRVQARLDSLLVEEGSAVNARDSSSRRWSRPSSHRRRPRLPRRRLAQWRSSANHSRARSRSRAAPPRRSAPRRRASPRRKPPLPASTRKLAQDSADAARATTLEHAGAHLTGRAASGSNTVYRAEQSMVAGRHRRSVQPRRSWRTRSRDGWRWRRRRARSP